MAISCHTQDQTDLERNEMLKRHFNSRSITELSHFLAKFDDNIEFEKTNEFFIKVANAQKASEIYKIDSEYFSNQRILSALSNETKQEIWKIEESFNSQINDSIQTFSINLDGEYFKFLSEYSKNSDGIFKEYFESLEDSGDLSPAMVSSIQKNWEKLDLKNDCNRLIIAIHYATIANSIVL